MKRIILFADGAFGKIEMLKWCVQNKVDAEFRMTKSKQTSRTIKAVWHEMNLYLTA
jgi:hypothetical protein